MKIAPVQMLELRERPIPEIMRAEEKMKTQLSMRRAARNLWLGEAAKTGGEAGWGGSELKRTDPRHGNPRVSLLCRTKGRRHLEMDDQLNSFRKRQGSVGWGRAGGEGDG